MADKTNTLLINLDDVSVDDIKVLDQEGSRGIAEFAASTSKTCSGQCSCTVNQDSIDN
ncbi:MAG: hypothetical protein AAGD01_19330 [Acidobacteriota bacterium]